ncbi:hypothetical protein HID58_094948 [Brassica napus]|uniref:Uncharacterized protein n=1 Tax=Brassica napus TaxID=3708 RepID=A0ABQ7X7P3_BRANA|nr:hypothetical protein HID58_094948 [Brassica napus]
MGRLRDITRDFENGTSEFMFYQRWTPWLVLIYRNGDMVMLISISVVLFYDLLRRHGKVFAQGRIIFHGIKLFGFSEGIPQQSFTDMLSTDIRMRLWGIFRWCFLGERENSIDHLLFTWPNTFTFWGDVAGRSL